MTQLWILMKLLFTFIKIGAFCFGGGYAMLPLIQHEVVTVNHWLSSYEFSSIVVVSQITPGPIAINSATYAGYKASGVLGSISATLGIILVSLVIVTVIAKNLERFKTNKVVQGFLKGINPAVISMLILAAYNMVDDWTKEPIFIGIAACCMLLAYFSRLSPILIMCLSGLLGWIMSAL